MTNPSVAAIMLVDGRPEMTARAVRSFEAQTYENRKLIVWDTGHSPLNIKASKSVYYGWPNLTSVKSIGELRNDVIRMATLEDVIVTFDSDDVSHPRRIEEQVALLQSSGAEVVGYNEVLFWREAVHLTDYDVYGGGSKTAPCDVLEPEAYIYSNPRPNYVIGASLAFWRSTWLRRPFPHLPVPGNRQSAGEDAEWLKGVRCLGVSSISTAVIHNESHRAKSGNYQMGDQIPREFGVPRADGRFAYWDACEPRLICSIHGGNSQMYELALGSPQFKRVPEWDEYCRVQMRMEAK